MYVSTNMIMNLYVYQYIYLCMYASIIGDIDTYA